MSEIIFNGPPSPEEIQKQVSEFMRQQFQSFGAGGAPQAGFSGGDEGGGQKGPDSKEFQFDYKPREIKEYLDRFVIKQDEAKKVLSVAMCDHYHQVRLAMEGKAHPNYTKQHILLMGPTGVGKTYLIRSIADLIGVPFVKGDATKFSETGYVGGDVEDLVRELVRRADGDIERAQYGIIYIDEIDKIASVSTPSGRDVSGRGVQTNLLKLMEETDVPARSQQDIAGQVQAMFDLTRGGKKSPATVNTQHILFIVSGAFDGLQSIVTRRLREAAIGFASQTQRPSDSDWMEQVTTRDFIDFGFEPEFIGRLPVRVVCHPLEVDDLFAILKDSEGSIIRQYEQSFAAYGINALFQEDGLREIAAAAAPEKTGARGLMTVCERVFRDFKYELPSTSIRQFDVGKEMVAHPEVVLKELLEEHKRQAPNEEHQLVHEFARKFTEEHGLAIRFTPEAAGLVAGKARDQAKPIPEFCALHFKDFQFGLKLVAQNTGTTEFLLAENVVEQPDKILSEWVVASYRQNQAS
jgi:ATP-dependent Clp protease ATP-binding subunit ClpX